MTTFVSFYAGPGYAEEAAGLVESLESWGYPHQVVEREDKGSWIANCAQKPVFLREMRKRFFGPIVWIDADARVLRAPVLFKTLDADMAYHRKGSELLSGTLYFGDTDGARQILDAWCEAQDEVEMWDQRVLANVLTAGNARPWLVGLLPAAYCAIFDSGVEDPVILHRQASRRLRMRRA